MLFVTLKPLTNKAKNRIREAGNPAKWVVVKISSSVVFSDRPGPWLFLRPDGQDQTHARWVNELKDFDFEVQYV